VGFRDPSHFARDFRRFHGLTPSAVRGSTVAPGPASPRLLDHLMAIDIRTFAHDSAGRLEREPRRGHLSRVKRR
jgi:hypothetical protein